MKNEYITIGGSKNRQRLISNDNYITVPILKKYSYYSFNDLDNPTDSIKYEHYRLETIKYTKGDGQIISWTFWVFEELSKDEAFIKIIESY